MNKDVKSCLVITYGPVPTPEYQTIEGGGMRAWGLAKGLKENGIDVTIAINQSFPQKTKSHEGIKLENWCLDDDFKQQINSYDAVLISFCMGDPSVFVADNISNEVALILDCYVPIYVEVSARNAEDMPNELRNYREDVLRHNHTLKRGDYFLCANEPQKTYYIGVLSALNIINPRSYRDERLLVCPFGVHDEPLKTSSNPYLKLGVKKADFTVLWFGGLYPWFRVDELLEAMESLSLRHSNIKFVFVGGKNPFNPNPDFERQYTKAIKFAAKKKLIDKQIYFVDWVDFDTRIDWFKHADVIISLNNPGEENKLSWRTRVMDFVWAEAPMITNGGDPLSDELIESDAAIPLSSLTSTSIERSILDAYRDRDSLKSLQKNIKDVKVTYFWGKITSELANKINSARVFSVEEREFLKKNSISNVVSDTINAPLPKTGALRRIIAAPVKIVRHARQKGVYRTLDVLRSAVKTQASNLPSSKRSAEPNFVFIAHPMNMTGAPVVLMDIIEETVKKYGPKRVHLVTPSITKDIKIITDRLDIRVSKAVHGIGFRFIRAQLGLKPHDFVMINTIAIYDNYRDFIMLWLKTGRLKHAHWFIHEDKAQIDRINHQFMDKININRLSKRINKGLLSVYTPSDQTTRDYNRILHTENVKTLPLRVHVPDRLVGVRDKKDYENINILISGTPSDGRKAQLLALSALKDFYLREYLPSPDKFRDFTLHLVAIGDDYISQQIKWIADSLDGHVKIYPVLPKDEAMKVTALCNVNLCLSLNETFGLYIAEGMLMGHILLRNDTAGLTEQLSEGVNGYRVYNEDVRQVSDAISKIVSRKTSTARLKAMGDRSYEMAIEWSTNTYLDKMA